jgi:hypothetical protein
MTQASVQTPVADETTGEVTMNTDSNVNVYNEGGQRMSKTEEGEEERYFYTGSTILYTKNQHGDLRTENIVDLSGRIIASKRFDDDGDPGHDVRAGKPVLLLSLRHQRQCIGNRAPRRYIN